MMYAKAWGRKEKNKGGGEGQDAWRVRMTGREGHRVSEVYRG